MTLTYYLSWWIVSPLAFFYGKLAHRIQYGRDFAGIVIMSLVLCVPLALVAAAVGATVNWLVESEKPLRWTMCPALLYALPGFVGYHFVRPPLYIDRVSQTICALVAAGTCLIGGILAERKRAFRINSIDTPH